MPKGKAIALLFLQNSESFPEFSNFAPNSKSAKSQGYSLSIFKKFTNFAKFRNFRRISQFFTDFKKCHIYRYFVPKWMTITLLFLLNSKSFPEFCNFALNSKSANRQGYSLTILTKLIKFPVILQFCTKFKKCQKARL